MEVYQFSNITDHIKWQNKSKSRVYYSYESRYYQLSDSKRESKRIPLGNGFSWGPVSDESIR
jgi:hypothetical protein